MLPLVRPARKEDVPAIVALFREDELHSRTGVDSGPLASSYFEAFAAIDADPNNHVYVAELAGQVVGTFQLTFIRQLSYRGSTVAQVESVYVREAERSRGIGGLMMRFAIDEARRRGCVRVQLTSNVARERAHRFYERLGFEVTHRGMKLYLRATGDR